MPQNIESYNRRMVDVVASQKASGRSIYYHDVNCNRTDGKVCATTDKSTWADGDYYTWGIHFSFSGYAKMAAQWLQALQPHLPPFPPPVSGARL